MAVSTKSNPLVVVCLVYAWFISLLFYAWFILSFNPLEFEGFKKEAGLNAFTLSPKKWIDTTNAIGLIAKSGRYGGTYAHKDIAG